MEQEVENPMDKRESTSWAKVIYEQEWRSQMAGVTERLFLTSITFGGTTFAGFLARGNGHDTSSLPLVIFLMALSVWAALFTFKSAMVVKAHENAAKLIVKEYGLKALLPSYGERWVKRVSIGKLYPILFSGCFCFLLFLLLRILVGDCCRTLVSTLVPLVLGVGAAIYIYKFAFWPDEEMNGGVMGEMKATVEMQDSGPSQKTPEKNETMTLEDIDKRLRAMEKTSTRQGIYIIGFGLVTTGLGTLVASGVSLNQKTLGWVLFGAGWVVMISIFCIAQCKAHQK